MSATGGAASPLEVTFFEDGEVYMLPNEFTGDAAQYRAHDILAYHILKEPIQESECMTFGGVPLWTPEEWIRSDPRLRRWIAVSANMPNIHTIPLGEQEVIAYSNGKYGRNDRSIHPQFIGKRYEWMPLIPRFRVEWAKLWWTPKPDDAQLIKGSAIQTDIRVLADHHCQELKKQLDIHSKSVFDILKRNSHAVLLSSYMLKATQSSYPLRLAISSYVDVYYKRMFPTNLEDLHKTYPVDKNLMGGFTHDPEVAQLYHRVGIPVVCIRAMFSLNFSDTKLHLHANQVVPIQAPEVIEEEYRPFGARKTPYQVIYRGPQGTALQDSTLRLGSHVVDMIEPSKIIYQKLVDKHSNSPPVPVRPIQEITVYSIPPPAQVSTSTSAATPTPVFSLTNAASYPLPNAFDYRPPVLSLWQDTIASTKLPTTISSSNYVSSPMPDPTIFLNANPNSRLMYLATWVGTRSVHLNALLENMVLGKVTKQNWRTYLLSVKSCFGQTPSSYPALSSQTASTSSAASCTSGTPSSDRATLGKRSAEDEGGQAPKKSKHLKELPPWFERLKGQLQRLDKLFWYELEIPVTSEEDVRKILTPEVMAEILWEIFEVTWRVELLLLDQHKAPEYWATGNDQDSVEEVQRKEEARAQRELAIRKVFSSDPDAQLVDLFPTEIPNRDFGVAAWQWEERWPALKQLHSLMTKWENCPDLVKNAPLDFTETSVTKLESIVVGYYVRAFADSFGRHPVPPARLPFRSRTRELPARVLGSSADMSFKPPRAPILTTATTPSRSTWRRTNETPVRQVYGSKALLVPQVDLRTTTGAFVQQKTSNSHHQRRKHGIASPSPLGPSQQDRRMAEHQNWCRVIKQAITPYLTLLHVSKNLRLIPRILEKTCSCHVNVRKVDVILVSFDNVEAVSICACQPTITLLSVGFVASAPIRPTLAFDIKMLEFARELYLHSPPNSTAWTSAWESFLRGRGLTFSHPDFLRRKFSKAIRYYSLLQVETEVHVRKIVLRAAVSADEDGSVIDDDDDGDWIDEDAYLESDYLPHACALCFAATTEPDPRAPSGVVVCIDACFVHKRRQPARGSGSHDPPIRHPRSAFLTEEEVEAARRLVERICGGTLGTPHPGVDDSIEPGMKLAQSILNACSESFTAADETRIKANPAFFADTGLMAMLCRHDRVVYLANMTTPGERQYYAIALIIKLFKALPSGVTVGILYDIGCQLHRSCNKWDLIPEYADRIIWGISVFHAYGHQWPCQLIYHPRKCRGFGLSDGEGCERFWSSTQGVVPSLRVSGYHQRLFTLDLLVDFLRREGEMESAEWISRKWKVCMARREAAEQWLTKRKCDTEATRALWNDQVQTQTRPLTRATGHLAKAAIRKILELSAYSKSLASDIRAIDQDKLPQDANALAEVVEKRAGLVGKKEKVDTEIRRARAELGASEKANLKNMMNSKYLQLRMQAKALRDQIQSKLQNRRFELERLDRSYNRVSASERRLQQHVKSSNAGKSPSILTQVAKYNSLCDEIGELIRKKRASKGAVQPQHLDRHTIFSLDVDDPIWNDRGLDGDEDRDPPLWLADDGVREDIKAVLMLDRCSEEECYLIREATLLQVWFSNEWRMLSLCIEKCGGDESLVSYLLRQQSTLLYMGAVWFETLDKVGLIDPSIEWGPSVKDMAAAVKDWWGGKEVPDSASDADSYSTISDDEEIDPVLEDFDWMTLDDDQEVRVHTAVDTGSDKSPRKRARMLSDDV
ncbi:hypothetical protein NMY22_g4217 [Coprinellus aureogranulatus]|nr:hypothetical protein NMY22_g4217 [Coprinellus aureogranulatus]